MNRVFLIVVLMLCGRAIAGCAIHYFDPTTGTEHLWGFGHMRMKVGAPNEGLQALVRETQTIGLAVGSLEAQSYLSLGIQRKRRTGVLRKVIKRLVEVGNTREEELAAVHTLVKESFDQG